MHDAIINLWALTEQCDLIDRAAALQGKNRSDFILEVAYEKAQALILDQIFFSINSDKFQQLMAMISAPPSPNPGLERLMAVTPTWLATKSDLNNSKIIRS